MICIDSDVFLIDLRYPADRRAATTRLFLKTMAGSGAAATTVFNLLEVTGVLSFNLSDQQVVDFYAHFPRRYNLRVLPITTSRAGYRHCRFVKCCKRCSGRWHSAMR